MKKMLLLLCLLAAAVAAHAQVETITRRQAVKVNLHAEFTQPEQHLLIGQPAPALVLRGDGRAAHEFELTRFQINRELQTQVDSIRKQLDTSITRVFDLGIRYQFDFFFLKKIHAVNPYIGLSGFVGIDHAAMEPGSPIQYPVNTTRLDFKIDAVPGFQANLTRRIFLDVSAPIGLLSFQYNHNKIENPVWTASEQTKNQFLGGFPQYTIRGILGLGLRF